MLFVFKNRKEEFFIGKFQQELEESLEDDDAKLQRLLRKSSRFSNTLKCF